MEIGICKVCGKATKYKYKSWVKECCSYKCSNTLKWNKREKEKTKKHNCLICRKEFYIPLSDHRLKQGTIIKYCSRECMGIGMRTRQLIKCKYCEKEFETTRNKFCSHKCAIEHKKENYNHKTYKENGYNVLFINGYNKKGNVKEHRLIMENHLKRKLKPNEVVHHINEIKTDNRLENLKVMTISEHSKYHRELEIARGKELFGR